MLTADVTAKLLTTFLDDSWSQWKNNNKTFTVEPVVTLGPVSETNKNSNGKTNWINTWR